VFDTPNNETRPTQGAGTNPAQEKSARGGGLDTWAADLLADRHLSGHAIRVGLAILANFDRRTGFASPSIRKIAAATGLSRTSTERAMRTLVATEHLRLIAGGGGSGNSNIYQMGGTR
jgi:hypothetical protein